MTMQETPLQLLYGVLVESIRLVAAPADVQFASVPDFVVVCDEVSTTFSEAVLLVPQLQEHGPFSLPAVAALNEPNGHLSQVPDDVREAEDDDLDTHPFWEQGRRHAIAALNVLGEDRAPNLTGVTWVPGAEPAGQSRPGAGR